MKGHRVVSEGMSIVARWLEQDVRRAMAAYDTDAHAGVAPRNS